MNRLSPRLATHVRDAVVTVALLAVVFALSTALIWLVPFQWTPPRVVA